MLSLQWSPACGTQGTHPTQILLETGFTPPRTPPLMAQHWQRLQRTRTPRTNAVAFLSVMALLATKAAQVSEL